MAKDIRKNDITRKTLRHYIDLEFYANGVDADLQALLDEVTTDCEEVIESQKSYSTKDGYSLAYRAIKEKIESFGAALDERLEKEAGTVKENEEKFLKGLYGAALAVTAVPLSKVLFAPVDGKDTAKTFAERAKKNLIRTYDTALRSGYIFAKPSNDIISQARAALPQIKRGIQAGIQTAVPAAAKTTDSIIFAANALEVVWCITLDGNVCLECASLSGQHFKSMSDAPSLPRHNRCRCVLLPAAMISEPLPSYQEFIESLPEDEQKQVLGKNRYELYKNGQVSLKQFLNNGKILRLDELNLPETLSLKNTGVRSEIVDILLQNDVIKNEKIAAEYYSKVRAGGNSDMIARIAENTGKTYSNVEQIVNHIFKEPHRFANGTVKRFDPDADIVLALERLRTDEHTDKDILLLNHELTELTYMKNKKYNIYETAHELANLKFDWEKNYKK